MYSYPAVSEYLCSEWSLKRDLYEKRVLWTRLHHKFLYAAPHCSVFLYSGGFITSPHIGPVGNFVYRFTKSPQIQVDMLIERTTTARAPRPYLHGVTPATDEPFVWSRTGTVPGLRDLLFRWCLVFSDWTWQTRRARLILERLWSKGMKSVVNNE